MTTRGRRFTIIARVVFAVLAAGCGTTHQWIYEKPGMTPESLDRDRAACRAAAPPQGLTKLFEIDDVDRASFTRCMEQRGYTARRETL
jgi:hypothetical protein